MQFFSSKHVSRPPDSYPNSVSNINSNSPGHSNAKLGPCCGPPRRIRSYGVAPPAGSNPTMWPPRGIESYGVAPPAGLNPTMWPPPRDRILRYGPSRRIGLSAVAPPGGLDFPMWPIPGDRILRCGPPHGIDCHTAGSFEYSLRAFCCL